MSDTRDTASGASGGEARKDRDVAAEAPASNFIKDIVEEDLRAGRHDGRVAD